MLDPIVYTATGKVTLSYLLLPEFKLEMDFNPIIEWFKLNGSFCLLHWQAKPFGQRRWGIYDVQADQYNSLKYCELQLQVVPHLLQVDENIIKTVPTAVLFFPCSKLIKNGYYSIVAV